MPTNVSKLSLYMFYFDLVILFICIFFFLARHMAAQSALLNINLSTCSWWRLYNLTLPNLNPFSSLYPTKFVQAAHHFIFYLFSMSSFIYSLTYRVSLSISFSYLRMFPACSFIYYLSARSRWLSLLHQNSSGESESRTSHVCWLGSFHTRATLIIMST